MEIQPTGGAPPSRPVPAPIVSGPRDRIELGTSPGEPTLSAHQAAEILSQDRGPEGLQKLFEPVPFEKKTSPGHYQPIRLHDGTIVINGQKGTHGFRADGSLAWHLDTGDCSYRAPVPGDDGVLYLRTDRNLIAIRADHDKGEILWQKPLGKRGTSAAPVVAPDGHLYVADNDYRLWILRPDGSEKDHLDWPHLMSDEPNLLNDGKLLLHGYDGWTAVLNPHVAAHGLRRLIQKEKPELEQVVHAQVLRPAGVGPDGTIYQVHEGQTIQVLEPDGKTPRWEYRLDRRDVSVHVTLRPDGAVYVLSGSHQLTALSPEGKLLWNWRPGGDVAWDYTLDKDGTAYFTGEGGNWKAYAVDQDGHEKWTTPLSSHGANASLGPLDTLLIGGDMHPLRVLDRSTGKLIHEEPMSLAFGDRPVVALEDGTIYAATDSSELVGFKLRTRASISAERMEAARTAPQLSEPPPEIKRGEGVVIIGGVTLPSR